MALNKKYSVAAATLPYVLLCYAFFILSPQIIGGETFVLIPTAMLFLGSALYAAGLYFYLKADKKIFLHASAAYSAAGALVPSILFMMWADMTEGVCFMVCVLLAAAFYVLGALTLKSASSDGRPFGLLPVSVFSFLLAGILQFRVLERSRNFCCRSVEYIMVHIRCGHRRHGVLLSVLPRKIG